MRAALHAPEPPGWPRWGSVGPWFARPSPRRNRPWFGVADAVGEVVTPLPAPPARARWWPGALPDRRYVPGVGPHPVRSGALAPAPVPQDEHDRHDLFARGVDLFEQNYLWEAHEVWEAAWRAAPVSSVEREALGTLIQLAAAVLTSHLGRRCASDDLVARVRERLAALGGRGPEWRGLSWASLGASVDRFAAGGPWPSLAPWLPELRVVGGVLARSGRVLGAQRPGGDSLAGRWEIPGGKVEEGESDTQALERELGEELGVRVLAGRRLAEVVYPYPARRVRLLALECRLEAGEPRPLHHRGLRWFGPGELGEVRWAPADVPLLDALAAAASASEG